MTEPEDGGCKRCGNILTGRQKSFCSAQCQKANGRNTYLLETYGITVEQWNELFDFQGGVCYICQRPPHGQRKLVVDHEHNRGPSGRVRGLLCSIPCNLRLVAKHKNGDQLRRAADYLDNPPAVELWGTIIAPGRKKRVRTRLPRGKKR